MTRAIRLLAVLALVFVTGCTKLVEEEPTPTPLATPADAGKPVFTAKKGNITEVVKGLGRVAATDEATLYFKQSGRLKKVYVEVNQQVKKGDRLAEMETGSLQNQVDQARIQVEIAQLGLQRALEKASANQNGDAGIHQAAARIAQAESSRAQAVAGLQKATAGPPAADVQAADAAVAAAKSGLESAQAALTKLQTPKSPDEVAAAKAALEKAQAARDKAQADYDRIHNRPDAPGSPQAVALQQATADYDAALAKFNLANQTARPEDVAAAQKAVQSAQAALDSAQARRDQVVAGPASADVDAARAQVQMSEANLQAARADYDAKVAAQQNSATGQTASQRDVEIAPKQVQLASVGLKTLEDQLNDSVLIAPFDGIVTDTRGREGDQVNAYTPVVVTANPTSILIAFEVPSQDLPKVKLGQPATVAVDAFKGQKFEEKVVGLPQTGAGPQPADLARTVKISFNPPQKVDLGVLANVTITTQKKDDVLMIPNSALRRFGGRRYVVVVGDNDRKREVDVDVGIQTDTEVEITKGITEGTKVQSQ